MSLTVILGVYFCVTNPSIIYFSYKGIKKLYKYYKWRRTPGSQ